MAPLSHIRILDLSRILAGPWASQTLADLGATVIKIEQPGSGDDTRGWGPPYVHDRDGQPTTDSAYYLAINRNKQSVAVDIATPEGQAIVRDLARNADVVIENFKVGGLAKYGLDYAGLKAVKPDLVYCSITGFGQTGPYAPRAGYDLLLQAMGGLMSITGGADGAPDAGPQRVGVAVVDLLTGMYAAVGILAALTHRDRTGEGQSLDIALLDVNVASLANQALNYLVSGKPPGRMGLAHPNVVPYQDFPTADGAMIVAVGNDGQFARFADALGLGAMAADPAYATNAARVVNRVPLIAALSAATATRPTKHWVEVLEAATVPCGPINDIAQVFADEQVVARQLALDLPHPVAGSVPTVASPLRLSASPVEYRNAPPPLGHDTREVLARDLGLGADMIDDLVRRGIVAC
ncbi:CaiB/BaiF CoA transferase family protein [Glacieibacterium frigidum]|uniref:CoA transferase n=1 Tax=Glacieibacterium frigidum TaxID=2593303 RepID=A0A552UAX6_9SPHN|nr:CoA transferase [Glacieibacterium frigidum]